MIEFTADKNQKLSVFLKSQNINLSYANLMKALRKKDVKINGVRVNKDVVLAVGDKVVVYARVNDVLPYTLIFKDDNVLVIDKPSGFTSETVFESLQKNYNEIYFIHRLDRNTSGLMIFALNKDSENELLLGFKNRTFDKRYLCEVYGTVKDQTKTLTAYLVKDAENSTVKIYDTKVRGGVEIKTGYTVLKQNAKTALLEVFLYTGKTHQIRAHLAHIGHFIVGDGKYGDNVFNKSQRAKTQRLIAYKLTLKFTRDSCLYYLNDKTFLSENKL